MKVLVTGGGGFLGGRIVRRLKQRGDQVVSYSRQAYEWHKAAGVESTTGELNDINSLTNAMLGVDAVIHVAAKAGFWGPYGEYHKTNVEGTACVIEACRRAGVKKLVYTSTPSVVHGGGDLNGVDESAHYPEHHESAYAATKAEAEKQVLKANSQGLLTVALRPHLIWGPGDPHLLPRLLARAKAGRLRRIGDGLNIVDTVHIENAALAHELALDRLKADSPIAGQAYFIAQGEPMPMWDAIQRMILASGGPELPKRPVSISTAMRAGSICEWLWKNLPLPGEPPMTRFVASQLSSSHWFCLDRARKELGYMPVISFEEGLKTLSGIPSQS
ncbi:MAG: 3-beta hydroxysteroid dehydrogenase [Planctomycetota bacterium]|jgi:nucleoside-diphosphate-sugar epimerase